MNAPVDLGLALDQIVAVLAAQFPSFRTVAAEDEGRRELAVPALVVQFAGIEPEPDRDPHTGQLPAIVRVEARVVLGHRTAKVRRESIKAAAAVATFVHNHRFGVAWGAGVLVAIEPDEFAPIIETHDVWLVEWGHSVHLGDSYFVDEGETPVQVLSAWSPRIGPAHEADYDEVTDV